MVWSRGWNSSSGEAEGSVEKEPFDFEHLGSID